MNRKRPESHKANAKKSSAKKVLQRLRIPNRQVVGVDVTVGAPVSEASLVKSFKARRHEIVIPFLTKKKSGKHESKKS